MPENELSNVAIVDQLQTELPESLTDFVRAVALAMQSKSARGDRREVALPDIPGDQTELYERIRRTIESYDYHVVEVDSEKGMLNGHLREIEIPAGSTGLKAHIGLHELAHLLLGHTGFATQEEELGYEFEAEAVAYIVGKYVNLPFPLELSVQYLQLKIGQMPMHTGLNALYKKTSAILQVASELAFVIHSN